jgi:LCP family protein required for cell wall assembly
MPRPRRRLLVGVLVILAIVLCTATLRIGLKWKRALDNVEVMRVAPVTLPTLQPTSKPVAEYAVAGTVPTAAPTPAGPTPMPGADAPINILLLGTDARLDEEISRTDAIILVHIDPHADRIGMLSFPRDLWVSIPGYGKNRINAAYPTGEKKIGTGYGPALAKETVGQLVDVPVQRFVMINFDGFKTLIDKLDGIYIDVPKTIDDPKYPIDEYPGDVRTMKVHFDPGQQLMDGQTALIYARTRHADSDFGRNQRQQQVLLAIFERIRDQGLLTQLTSIDDYTDALRDYVRTDLSRSEIMQLSRLGPRLHADSIERYAISPKMVAETTNPYRLTLTDPKALHKLVQEMLGESVAAAGGASEQK